MIESSFEALFDLIDESIQEMYKIKKDTYLNLLLKTANSLVTSEIEFDCTEEESNRLDSILRRVEDIDFNVDDVRKAFMMHVIRAHKDDDKSISSHTPDAVAQIMSFLGKSLLNKEETNNILDISGNTGNLVATFLNSLDGFSYNSFVIEPDNVNALIIQAIGNLLEYNINIYNQNSLESFFSNIDLVISDLHEQDATNILYHLNSVKENGFMVLLVPIELITNEVFKEKVIKNANLISVINFNADSFKNEMKSIIILKKETKENKTLLVELPSFKKSTELVSKLLELQQYLEGKRE